MYSGLGILTPMLKNKPCTHFLPVIAPLVGADQVGLLAARNGGVLKLEGDSVAAYAGPRRYRIGYLRSDEVKEHLDAGGWAYFRACGGADPALMVCGLGR